LNYLVSTAIMSWKGRLTKIIGILIVAGIPSAANRILVILKSLERKCQLMKMFVQSGLSIVRYPMVAMQNCFVKNSRLILVCHTWEVDVKIYKHNRMNWKVTVTISSALLIVLTKVLKI
jgi:hypothetical protein